MYKRQEYGEVREQYGLLNMLHMFVNDFGEEFAPMIAVDSGNTVAADDTKDVYKRQVYQRALKAKQNVMRKNLQLL